MTTRDVSLHAPPPGNGVLERARRRALSERIPIAGAFELTTRCNLRCVHCYQGYDGTAAGELPTLAIRSLVDEAVNAGCLDVVLTGGEPLLRKDFGEIYRHVRERGALVTVFTNGTLIDDAMVSLFRELPAHRVEVSVYGATRETYESVTGVPGSHERCMQGIRRMHDRGVRVALKTVVLRRNQHEVEAVAALAAELDVPFRMDPVLCARLDGDPTPLAERASPAEAARLQFSDPVKAEKLAAYLATLRPAAGAKPVYRCDAGIISFYVTARGKLRPCLMTSDMEFDAVEAGFGRAWRQATRAIGQPTWDVQGRCRDCADLPICGYCPALIRLETGRATLSSEYLCELGRQRRSVIESVLRDPDRQRGNQDVQ